MPARAVSFSSWLYLFSGRLLQDRAPAGAIKDWHSPTGEMINGDYLFEEIFLLQTHWFITHGCLKLSFNTSLEPTDKSALILAYGNKLTDQTLGKFAFSLLQPVVGKQDIFFIDWAKLVGERLGQLNPALAMLQLIESELQQAGFLQLKTKKTLLIFTTTEKVWSLDRINQSKKQYQKVRVVYQQARAQPWWETARRQLRAGLTFARMSIRRHRRPVDDF